LGNIKTRRKRKVRNDTIQEKLLRPPKPRHKSQITVEVPLRSVANAVGELKEDAIRKNRGKGPGEPRCLRRQGGKILKGCEAKTPASEVQYKKGGGQGVAERKK